MKKIVTYRALDVMMDITGEVGFLVCIRYHALIPLSSDEALSVDNACS